MWKGVNVQLLGGSFFCVFRRLEGDSGTDCRNPSAGIAREEAEGLYGEVREESEVVVVVMDCGGSVEWRERRED